MFKKLYEDSIIPTRATKLSAGYDLYAHEAAFLAPGIRWCISTGVAVDWKKFPQALDGEKVWEAQIRPRSGLAIKHGLTVLNAPGTIDADYDLELKVILINHGGNTFHVRPGDRIAQLVFSLAEIFDEVDVARSGGFGSSGT